jgi:fructose-1,6-bisphosphatase/inositol monophosphatase family enzyme
MHLDENQLNELCTIAKDAALAAGKIISSKDGSDLKVETKSGGENIASCVVTEIDIKAQEAILKTLTPTLERFDLGLLTEESTDDNSRFSHDYFWCIDPLDGTLCYSQDKDGYSTSIALVSKNGDPIIGVVYNPRHDNLYSAIKGQGAYKNDRKLVINERGENLTLLFDQSYLKHPQYNIQIEKLKSDLKEAGLKSLVPHELGGAVMNGISTIEMAPAVYYKFPKKAEGGGSIWDFAASSVIQSEAGGLNSNYHREKIDLNRADSTFMNHEGIIFCSSKDLLNLIP